MIKNKTLGSIIQGSLTDGFDMRVSKNINIEEIKTGKFVAIKSGLYTFFSMITNVTLQVTHPDILLYPPTEDESLLINFLKEKNIYATAHIKPMIALSNAGKTVPVKTIPQHFSTVVEASNQDVTAIFGNEADNNKKYFSMGSPLDMEASVCIDLEKLAERSTAIFGKSGTGKTFLTRLLLAGLVKKKVATTIIFDMHNEYGLQARQESSSQFVKGLKSLFPSDVAIFSLDPTATRRRGMQPDVVVQISYQDIKVEDILCLQAELNLHSTACEAAYLVAAKYKDDWLKALLESGNSLKEFAESVGAHPESIAALYRKLKRIESLPFFIQEPMKKNSMINRMMEFLAKDIHVVIEFGNFTSTFCYLLMANIITRRIHHEYMQKTEKFLGSQKKEDEPKQLMIVIEEAHKFLNPIAATQTIFGTIAREMRKYFVTLFIIDQRPSSIEPEVLSQIGSKIIAQLSDEKDLQAVLTGCQNSADLKAILASLDSKKQALLIGHAITMPMVIETRNYDAKFYQDMQSEVMIKPTQELINEIF